MCGKADSGIDHQNFGWFDMNFYELLMGDLLPPPVNHFFLGLNEKYREEKWRLLLKASETPNNLTQIPDCYSVFF